jgi:hypothetical protein
LGYARQRARLDIRFAGKVMAEEPNAFSLKIGHSFVVE